jgi:hypothetical protein
MFPSVADAVFFQSRQPVPAWVDRVYCKAKRERRETEYWSSLDNVINAHAGIKTTASENAAYNLLVIVRHMRGRNKDLVHELVRISADPGCPINPKRRAAFAMKWARRMEAT